uniref:Phage/plasmid primase, P4 family n=1 Tax=Bosea sp. NBC_00436 TaxID=2969620 RepID=A0A9E8CSX3_9HYPH
MGLDPHSEFVAAMATAGIRTPDKIIGDGKLHRIYVEGDRKGSKNGHYVLHLDHPASGAFGSYRLGISDTWTIDKLERLSQDDREALRKRMEQAARERADELAKSQATCRTAAAAILAACEPASPSHPYLVRKGLKVTPGLKQLARDVRYEVNDEDKPRRVARKGVLVIPIYGPDKTLHSVQTIDDDGRKHFLSGTNKAGHYWSVGKLTPRIVIGEGFSTCSTIHSATGLCTVIAFDAGNLKPVARAIRAKYPEHEIVIGADNDRFTMKPVPNPGMTKACEAAAEVGGLVAWPEFEPGALMPNGDAPTDFNDLAALRGNTESVAAAFEAAQRPADIENHTDPRRDCETASPATSASAPSPKPDLSFPGDWPDGYKPPVPVRPVPEGQPLIWSERFLADEFGHLDHPTLVRYRGEWLHWRNGAWFAVGDDEVRGAAYSWAQNRVVIECEKTGLPEPFKPDRRKIADLLDALKGVASVPSYIDMPGLLGALDVDPERALPVANGILDLRRRRILPASPRLFVASGSAVEYLPAPAPPSRWLQFLAQLWPGDTVAMELLQEWFGLCLSSYTGLQKALLVIGPKRSGKGTIQRVLTQLVGVGAVCAPTLGSLATPFGLAPLIGKRVALVGDARLSGRSDIAQIVERLLGITGEDFQSIDRKHRDMWTGKLPTRFAIFSNEMPSFRDASGALAGRFVVLRMQRSFFGEEDRTLFDQLIPELPGILNWALDGLARLAARGHFLQPDSSTELIDALGRSSSPVSEFLEDECEVSPAASVPKDMLYERWTRWCADQGLKPSSLPDLAQKLGAVIPNLKTSRPRGDVDRRRFYVGLRLR